MEQNRIMFNKWLYRRLPYFLRRRLTPQQSPFILVVLLAFIVIILQSFSLLNDGQENVEEFKIVTSTQKIRRRPLSNVIGIDPSLSHSYVPDQDHQFKCLSSSRSIPFEWINDDYCDCQQDGSDEPATGACQNSKFFCTQSSK